MHVGSFGLFVAGTVHGLTAGTDAGSPAFRLAAIAACAAVGDFTAIRLTSAARTFGRTAQRVHSSL